MYGREQRLLTTSEMIIAVFLTMALVMTTSLVVALQSYAVKGVKLGSGNVEFKHMDKNSCMCHVVPSPMPENLAKITKIALNDVIGPPTDMSK